MTFQRKLKICWALIGLVVMVSACAGKIPERGSPEWTKRVMVNKEILVSTDDVPNTRLKVVRAVGWSHLSHQAAWEIFQDIPAMKTYLYRIVESDELPRQGDKRIIRLVVNAPPVALTSGYDKIDITAEVDETISEDGKTMRGDFVAIKSNVKNAYGNWTVEEYEGGVLIYFSMFIDFGKVFIPDDAANFFVKDFLERWGKDLRTYAELPPNKVRLEQAAAKRAGKDPNKVAPVIEGMDDFVR